MPQTEPSPLRRLIASGLVTQEQLDECRQTLGEASADEPTLIEALVRHGFLTRWQADKLRAGRTDGFLLGGYRIVDKLGAGGMGKVYRAIDTRSGNQVAIKVLPRSAADREAVVRFQREGQAALSLAHANVVRTFELGCQGDTHFLVMEFVDGHDLSGRLANEGRLSVKEAVRIGCQTALALEYARRQGIVHRDIKPSNIFLTREGDVKLGDMGLARFFGEQSDGRSVTKSGMLMGTIDYLAPEQAEDAKRADTRSDIYSLGCTLYHCLTGQPPFAGGTEVQKIIAHREKVPTAIRALNDTVPQSVALVVERMLAKEREARFQTPMEVVDALKLALKDKGLSGSMPVISVPKAPDSKAETEPNAASKTEGRDRALKELAAVERKPPRRRSAKQTKARQSLRGMVSRHPVVGWGGVVGALIVIGAAIGWPRHRPEELATSPHPTTVAVAAANPVAAPLAIPGPAEPTPAREPEAVESSKAGDSVPDTPQKETGDAGAPTPAVAEPAGSAATENPFGMNDVPMPRGKAVREFAQTVPSLGNDSDGNAVQWAEQATAGQVNGLDGDWYSRWKFAGSRAPWNSGTATVKTVGDRVYILFKGRVSTYLIDLKREGDRLIGKSMNVTARRDNSPWVGLVVNNERIDGVWAEGRWDLRRKLATSAP